MRALVGHGRSWPLRRFNIDMSQCAQVDCAETASQQSAIGDETCVCSRADGQAHQQMLNIPQRVSLMASSTVRADSPSVGRYGWDASYSLAARIAISKYTHPMWSFPVAVKLIREVSRHPLVMHDTGNKQKGPTGGTRWPDPVWWRDGAATRPLPQGDAVLPRENGWASGQHVTGGREHFGIIGV